MSPILQVTSQLCKYEHFWNVDIPVCPDSGHHLRYFSIIAAGVTI